MCVVVVLQETTVVGLVRGITLPVAASAREVFMVEAIGGWCCPYAALQDGIVVVLVRVFPA